MVRKTHFLLSIVLLWFPHIASAGLSVGDWAEFELTTTFESGSQEFVDARWTVLKIDQANNTALLRQVHKRGDEVIDVFEDWQSLDELIDGQVAEQILAKCETSDVNGRYSTIMVPAGELYTCAIADDATDTGIWFYPSTFGLARLAMEIEMDVQGQTETVHLNWALSSFGSN